MKRIILTESQYKRLVKQKLNEYIVYSDPQDEYDAGPDIRLYLGTLGQNLMLKHNINTYVKKIEDGIVYLEEDKYSEEQKKFISDIIDYWVKYTRKDDKKVGEYGYFSGSDWNYSDEEIKDVEDDESTAEIEDDDVVVDYEPNKTYSRTEYINLVKDIAINQMKKHKIPASITIAQAVLESGNGNSKLARNGKNHFGIKCHGWTGDKSYHDDDRPNECFRNYDEIEDSFEDHSNFLKNNSRYKNLFNLDLTDYKGWAQGLQDNVYATSPTYAKTLISIIEKNNLQKYDNGGNIIDCENCISKISSEIKNKYETIINKDNIVDFRWWINQDSNRLKSVTDKLKECCETKSDPTISTSYNKKNKWTLVAFSVVGNEWINSGKPKRTFEILDIDETNLIKPSSNYGDSRDYGLRDPIPSLCNEGKTMYCTKHWHGGEDYPYPTGTEIYVFQPGEVIEKGDWALKIKHDDGSKTRYVHCDEFFVEKGDRIESGTLIGTVGNKGPTTGSHLHFEYWKPNENKTSNPKDIEDKYIRFKKKN